MRLWQTCGPEKGALSISIDFTSRREKTREEHTPKKRDIGFAVRKRIDHQRTGAKKMPRKVPYDYVCGAKEKTDRLQIISHTQKVMTSRKGGGGVRRI